MRAPGQTVLSVPMPKKLRDELNALAEKDNRKVAAFIRLHIQRIVEEQLRAPTKLSSKDRKSTHVVTPDFREPPTELPKSG
jgi:hypothetical protein